MESLEADQEADLEASKLKLNAKYPKIEKLCQEVGFNLDKQAREVARSMGTNVKLLRASFYQIAAMEFEQEYLHDFEEILRERKEEYILTDSYKEKKSELTAMRHEFFLENYYKRYWEGGIAGPELSLSALLHRFALYCGS